MSLKAELEIWASALKVYEENNLDVAIERFVKISDTSKVCWNIGIISATLGRHQEAIKYFDEAIKLDGYFTVAYQQKGVSNFMMGRYEAALQDFEDALLYLRGNQTINYEQLGLDFRLYSAEVLFNCGLSKVYLGQIDAGLIDLREASAHKQAPDHKVIDDAVRDRGRDYNVFSVPVGVLFKPSQVKLKNLAPKDYMGKAVLVAATDANDAYTTSTGITRLRRGQTPTGARLDPTYSLGRSASISTIPNADDKVAVARMSRSTSVSAVQTPPVRSTSTVGSPLAPSRSQSSQGRPTLRVDTDLDRNDLPRQLPSITKSSPFPAPATYDSPRGASPLLRTPKNRVDTLRITELYDNYYKEVANDDLPPLPLIGEKKLLDRSVTPLSSSNTDASRAPPSSFGRIGGLGRAPSRSGSMMSRNSQYEEEVGFAEMTKIRIKVHVGQVTRGMAVFPEQTYDDFVTALRAKFPNLGTFLNVRFRDEDGDMLSMQDEGDFEAAVDVARVMADRKAEGKLEIWVD